MEALTPASPDSLPAIGKLIADEPFWRFPLMMPAALARSHLQGVNRDAVSFGLNYRHGGDFRLWARQSGGSG